MTTALYCRVSTVDKQDWESQEKVLQEWAESQPGPFRWYKDKASGKDFDRQAFTQLLTDVRKGKVSRIVVAALDRLGRDTVGLLQLVRELKERRVGLLSLREGFDPFTPMGEFVLTCMAAMAKLEREHIRLRILSGIAAKRDPRTGKRGWGGRKEGTRIKVTVAKEKAIQSMVSQGLPKTEIAQVLGLTRRTVYRVLERIIAD
jgi:DNA invertase Pin-like site-specific DNA recombinase